jgi:hypothetical protein
MLFDVTRATGTSHGKRAKGIGSADQRKELARRAKGDRAGLDWIVGNHKNKRVSDDKS